ncbi:hypothetical protein ABE485_13680 [Achromobacter spanius]|uniref:hypothetical protein n=1 Tax=Achromobacter spanius TaxID=217203 RepID=UPI00320B18F3
MADYGLRIRNAALQTQIDSTYRNLSFWTKGTAIANVATGFVSWRSVTFTVPYTATSAFAWRCDFPAFVVGSTFAASSMTVTFLVYIVGGSAGTINWYVFAAPDVTGLPGGQYYGLRVKDALGRTAFDSRNQYMKYLAAIAGSDTDIPATQDNLYPEFLNFQMPVGSVPAVLQGNLATSIAEVPVGISLPDYMLFWSAACMRQSGSTVNLAYCVRVQGPYQQPINPPQIRRQPWSYTVIDVAGL